MANFDTIRGGHNSAPGQVVEPVSIDSVLRLLPHGPIKSSRGRGWGGVTIDVHAPVPAYFAHMPERDHHLLCICTKGRGRLHQRRASLVNDGLFSVGMSNFSPAQYESICEGDAPATTRLRMPVEFVERAANEIGSTPLPRVEFMNTFRMRDPMIENFGKLLAAEIDRSVHPAQTLMVEALSCALVAHLLRQYNAFDRPPNRQRGLAPQIVNKIIEYIEENVGQPIRLDELAAIAQVSKFHFLRLFRSTTGLSPIAYVERSRILRAQEYLKMGDLPIAEVALAVGFSDQSEFTRRFHRHVGTTPAVFARDNGIRKIPRRPR